MKNLYLTDEEYEDLLQCLNDVYEFQKLRANVAGDDQLFKNLKEKLLKIQNIIECLGRKAD